MGGIKNMGDFDKLSVEETAKKLETDSEKGLTSQEAQKRIEKYGENILETKQKSIYFQLLTFFWGPIPWMIEIAAVLSGYLQRWPDFIMIVALLLINAALGFFQEFKANNAIEALKQKLALKARVLRDGKWQTIDAKDLVPGDVTSVKLGNIIPADIKLSRGEYLTVDQSALTGESLPVNKKIGDMAFSGTIAKLGEMTGIVTETGFSTFFGRTAKLVTEAKTQSHFQQAVMKIGHFLIFLTLGIAAVLLIFALFRMKISHTLHIDLGNLAIFILVLVIAGIPVALPAVLSMTMAIGASRMAKLKAIVAKLIAIEELAGMDVLCSDKTGTLTKNELTVGDIQTYKATPEDVLLNACLASNLNGDDAIDLAIGASYKEKQHLSKYKITKFIPFDPVSKKTEALVTGPSSETFHAAKGAPQVILALANPDEKLAAQVNKAVEELAARGFRTLGVAKGDGKSWTFLGLIPLFDPPREDTKETIEKAKEMHVKVKMVTGDHTAIAKEIAGKLDLGTNIVPVSQLCSKDLTEEASEKMLEQADGFSEVFPEHKFQIVKRLQAKKHIVGMTGDGVNDAPALKQADIGIAVSNATDAARAAADLILTEPGLLVIKHAIDEARRIFGRMKSYAMYRISETCRLLFFLFLALVLFQTSALTAVMIIVIALLNDIPIMMIAYDHMKAQIKPVSWDMREVFTVAIGLAVVGVISTFGLFWIGREFWHFDLQHSRTLAFMAILCGGNLTIYLTRNTGELFAKPLPEWKFLLATLFSQVVGTLASVYGLGSADFVGIGWKYVGLSWLYIAVWFVICMWTKIVIYKILNYKGSTEEFLEKTSRRLHHHG
ncbi:MAG: plasma-membrane proton-efflux P-type ATPase [Simkania sp.]|nr:plasma-membrane proton-efflux P-type ATPase [Simkania sp.]